MDIYKGLSPESMKKMIEFRELINGTVYYRQNPHGVYEPDPDYMSKWTVVITPPKSCPSIFDHVNMFSDTSPFIVVNNGGLEVAGFNVLNRFRGRLRTISTTIKDCFTSVMEDVQHLADNSHRNPGRHKPVFSSRKEEWVEKAMWQMGMSRSKYKPTPVERSPFVNVGTIGHADFGKNNNGRV